MNRLEELGRVDSEKAKTKKGKKNLKAEKRRIVRTLKKNNMLKKIKNKICEIICKVFKIKPCVCDHECNCKKEKK
jgi:hypothetical protein